MDRKVYSAQVHGEYITQEGKERRLSSYKAVFRLYNIDNALSVIRGKLLMPFLKQNDPGAVAPYSWHIDKIELEGGQIEVNDIPVSFQTLAQLKEYCRKAKLPVPVEQYSDIDRCREHVMLARENVDTFKVVFERYKGQLSEEADLAELNKNFSGIGSTALGEVEVDPETGVVAPKANAARPAAATSARGRKVQPATTDDVLS